MLGSPAVLTQKWLAERTPKIRKQLTVGEADNSSTETDGSHHSKKASLREKLRRKVINPKSYKSENSTASTDAI